MAGKSLNCTSQTTHEQMFRTSEYDDNLKSKSDRETSERESFDQRKKLIWRLWKIEFSLYIIEQGSENKLLGAYIVGNRSYNIVLHSSKVSDVFLKIYTKIFINGQK